MNDTSGTPHSPYRVLARKYRPSHFGDLIGQEPMVRTLTNAFRSGRIGQAYMLTGVRGVGKTTTARILARALNYKSANADTPTIDVEQEGEHCRAILEGRHVDVIEMDAASHTGIDDIRDIIESVQYSPTIARYKVYIVDEVHMLSRNAFNGLLKTLEEPPRHLKFVFATTEIRKVPVTVLSRCQRFDLRRVDAGRLAEYLGEISRKEGFEAEPEALALIARASEGSVRDGLSILDQAMSHGSEAIGAEAIRDLLGLADRARILDLFEHVMSGNVAAALTELRAQYEIGAEPAAVLNDLADFTHFVTRLKYIPDAAGDSSISQAEKERGSGFAQKLSVRVLARAWQILLAGIDEVARTERQLSAAEMVLVRLAHATELPTPDELIRKLGKAGDSGASPRESAPEGRPASRPAPKDAQSSHGKPTTEIPQADPHTPVAMTHGSSQPATANLERAETKSAFANPATFEELVLLAEDRRDIKLRTFLRCNVRVASFSPGRMVIGLTDGTPASFVSELGERLEKWTGRRWTIMVSRDADQPTLEEVEREAEDARRSAAESDPAVAAILRTFPGSRVVNVRLRGDEDADVSLPVDPDRETESPSDG